MLRDMDRVVPDVASLVPRLLAHGRKPRPEIGVVALAGQDGRSVPVLPEVRVVLTPRAGCGRPRDPFVLVELGAQPLREIIHPTPPPAWPGSSTTRCAPG